jgi:phospholipid/cholesterol/gamma-HCH transport system permease protein
VTIEGGIGRAEGAQASRTRVGTSAAVRIGRRRQHATRSCRQHSVHVLRTQLDRAAHVARTGHRAATGVRAHAHLRPAAIVPRRPERQTRTHAARADGTAGKGDERGQQHDGQPPRHGQLYSTGAYRVELPAARTGHEHSPCRAADAKKLRVPGDGGYELGVERTEGALTLTVRGRIETACAQQLLNDITAQLGNGLRQVSLDLSRVDYFDSGGGAVLIALRQRLDRDKVALRITGSTPAIDGFLNLVDQDALTGPPGGPTPRESVTERLGTGALKFLSDLRDLAVFTGEIVLGLRDAALHPRRIRWRETWLYMERTGLDGIPIVSLISFLMGLITAFQAAIQLRQFGADIYIANLVGLSIVRELGPLMTAIIAAGRSGAAFAAEIGTMKVSEEVDALTTMGFDRTRFLVTPKVVALVFMLPCLTLISDLVGILGGLTVAVLGLDLPAQVYIRQTRIALRVWDVYSGLLKSFAFAILVAGVGCLRGFQASSGAESVGRITTSAIVAGIFLIIVSDAVFTVIFSYW